MKESELPKISVQWTKDYGRFKVLRANRIINDNHVRKLKKSMGEKQIPVPIVVNEKYEVIDGQHRKKALEQMEAWIPYIVIEGLSLPDTIRLNHDQANWKLLDYVYAFVERGNKDYETILDWNERFNKIQLIKVIAILQDKVYNSYTRKQIETGSWKIPDDVDLVKAEKIGGELDQFMDAIKKNFSIATKDFNAMLKLASENGEFNTIGLIEQIEFLNEVMENDEVDDKFVKSAHRKMLALRKAFKESESMESIIRKVKRWYNYRLKENEQI
jgi:hypothetical protein